MTNPGPVLTATPQINFSLGNPGAANVIYVSTDPTANQLTLVLTPTVAAAYTPGELVQFSDAPANDGSILFLDLTPLGLDPAVFEALALDAPGWTSKPFVDAVTGQNVLAFTPTTAVPSSTTPITFSLTGFALAAAPSGGPTTIDLDAFNVAGIISGDLWSQSGCPVSFAAPPGKKEDLRKVLTATLSPSDVVTSQHGYPDVSNNLMLTLAQSGQVAIPADENTVFNLSVVYATDVNGFGALLTAAEGDEISIPVPEGSNWHTANVEGLHGRSWKLTPPTGDSILGPDGTPLSFAFAPVVSTFQPGATVALLSYSGVPGYADGAFPLIVLKWPHVRIDSLTVDPPVSTLVDGDASVTLNWSAANTTQMTMQPLGEDVSQDTQCPADISDTQIFTIVAQGVRPGNVDNVATLSVTAVVLPVINAFTCTPPSVYLGDFGANGYRASLAWNVNINPQDSVNLTSSTSGMVGSYAAAVPQQPITLQAPQMLTLTPVGAKGSPAVNRSLIVSAFTLAPQAVGIGHDSGFAAAPSNASFVAVASPTENLVAILSSALATAHFQPMMTVPIGGAPQGIAFTPDGAFMLVAHSGGGGSVSAFAVASVSAQPPFTFTSQGDVHVGGSPQSIVIGPDGTAYVSVDLGASIPGQVAILAKSAGGYAAGTSVAVGNAPRGLAISPSGAELYVVNQGSGSVSRITLGLTPPAVSSLITGLNAPTDVMVTTDGTRFLVSSTGDNIIYGYNARFPTTAEKQTYPVPGAGYFGPFAGGHYALVTASGSQVALLNYAQATVAATCQLTAAPQSVTVPPGGGFALATMPGSGSVGLIVLAGYSQVAAATPAGGQITNVILSPDNQTLIAWFNASIAVSGGSGSPITGLVKGPANGAGLSPYLTGTHINAIAASPVAASDKLYVGAHGESAVSIYTLSTLASAGSIAIPALSGHANRQVVGLGVSGDGSTLFALTADGGLQFSMVVIAAKTQKILADLVVYQARMMQLSMPLAVAPCGVGGFAAYTVDTTTSNLWTVSGSGTRYSVSPSPIALGPGENAIATALACSPDGSTAYVALQSTTEVNYISVVDLAAGTATALEQPDPTSTMNLAALLVSPDGNKLFASDSAAAGIRVFGAKSLRIQQTLSWQEDVQSPYGLAVASDGSALYSANLVSQNLSIAQQINPA